MCFILMLQLAGVSCGILRVDLEFFPLNQGLIQLHSVLCLIGMRNQCIKEQSCRLWAFSLLWFKSKLYPCSLVYFSFLG
jgi:hypothetical protein